MIRYALVLALTFFWGTTHAQRLEKINQELLTNYLKEDLNFWKDRASFLLSNSKSPFVQLKQMNDAEWVKTSVTAKEILDLVSPKIEVPIFDSMGENVGVKVMRSYSAPRYFTFSDEPDLKNKIGFGFPVYNSYGMHVSDYIFFADQDRLSNSLNPRKLDFIKILHAISQYPKADSLIDVKINNRATKFHFFSLGSPYDNDTLPRLIKISETLLKSYEKDVAAVLYSGKDSSFYIDEDDFGNIQMKARSVDEFFVNVYDENGNPTPQRAVPYSIYMKELCLFFEKSSKAKKNRVVYLGATIPVTTSLGINLGYVDIFIDPNAKSTLSKTSQNLLDYLININL